MSFSLNFTKILFIFSIVITLQACDAVNLVETVDTNLNEDTTETESATDNSGNTNGGENQDSTNDEPADADKPDGSEGNSGTGGATDGNSSSGNGDAAQDSSDSTDSSEDSTTDSNGSNDGENGSGGSTDGSTGGDSAEQDGSEPDNTDQDTSTPANKPAVFSGDLTGQLNKNSASVSGKASVTDEDDADEFLEQTSLKTNYGFLTLSKDGAWLYELNIDHADIKALTDETDSLTDRFNISSIDGSVVELTITITGINNTAARFSGDLTGSVTLENTNASGKATVTDPDTGEQKFRTSVNATYGELTITTQGDWTYKLNTNHSHFANWNSAENSVKDTIQLKSMDGSTTQLVITIKGVDKPVDNKVGLFYLDENRLLLTKEAIAKKDPIYVAAYNELIKKADLELTKPIDPVTNKTLIAASGDIHDYHSVNPYSWPDTTKSDGLPWIYQDGKYNRDASTSSATDYNRRKEMLESLETLNLAFYLSEDEQYLKKIKNIVHAWFVDLDTKMNPNVNYGSSIPGKNDGDAFGILQWNDIGKVMTSVELIDHNKAWGDWASGQMQKWFNDYYNWLTTSELGIKANTRSNNHGTNYDHQVVGLQIYLGKIAEAEKQLQETKKRIDSQIASDGSQPEELKRTKSVNYTVNNLWGFTRVVYLAQKHTSVNLWSYNKYRLKSAFEFVTPYFDNIDAWEWEQATGGGVGPSFENLVLPRFTIAEILLNKNILPDHLDGKGKLNDIEILTYAPHY